jgi:hypothetical protein
MVHVLQLLTAQRLPLICSDLSSNKFVYILPAQWTQMKSLTVL